MKQDDAATVSGTYRVPMDGGVRTFGGVLVAAEEGTGFSTTALLLWRRLLSEGWEYAVETTVANTKGRVTTRARTGGIGTAPVYALCVCKESSSPKDFAFIETTEKPTT